jgi:hypothetical protein
MLYWLVRIISLLLALVAGKIGLEVGGAIAVPLAFVFGGLAAGAVIVTGLALAQRIKDKARGPGQQST